jgi:plastocyanin
MLHHRYLPALVTCCVCALAACGDDDGGTSGAGPGTSGTGASTSSASASSTASGAGGDGTGGNGTGGMQINGCSLGAAEDQTGQAQVDLEWTLPHQECLRISVGTTVTWTGTFSFHPLTGGVTPGTDPNSPITGVDQSGGSASVTFDTAGEFPYHCTAHGGSMEGVLYVE